MILKPMLLHVNDNLPIQHCHKLYGKTNGERKYDGERIIAEKTNGQVTLWGRENEKTINYPELILDLKLIKEDNFILDGEACVIRQDGSNDFPALQSRAHKKSPDNTDLSKNKVTLIAFDMLRSQGKDLRKPLHDRKEILHEFFKNNWTLSNVREISYTENLEWLWQQCLDKKWEGIVLKDWNGYYDYGTRTYSWLKMKPKKTWQLAVIGWQSKKRLISSLRTEKGNVTLLTTLGFGKEEALMKKIPEGKVFVEIEADAELTNPGRKLRFPIMKSLFIAP